MSDRATTTATTAPAAPAVRPFAGELLRRHAWRLGLASCTTGVAAFLLARLTAWPPHEDETLALFTGRESMHDATRTVLNERGGAPLHFLFAWLIAHTGGGLVELRLVSAFFAVASVPLIGLLVASLTDRTTALVATAIVSPSWMLLFHGVYGRMYSLFLFTSLLSYIALLRALERRDRTAWMLWALAMLACIATHPYGALVLTSQGLYVPLVQLARSPLQAALALAAAAVISLGALEIGWGIHNTARLYTGESPVRADARDAASAWLAATSRPNDVLFGYDPIFLVAWERN